MIKQTTCALLFILSLGIPCALQSASGGSSTINLSELKPVSSYENIYFRGTFAIAGVAYKSELRVSTTTREARMTFTVPAKMKSFVFDAGIDDGNPQTDRQRVASYRILLDGREVSGNGSGELANNQMPTHVAISVIGKKSLCIILTYGACLGDPRFEESFIPDQSSGEHDRGQASGKVPLLSSPADKAQVSGDAVVLKWQPVEGAVSYAISIVSYRSVDPASPETQRIWSATVKGTSYSFKLNDIPTGEYIWSVIAFGPTKPLGGFSLERIIVVDR